LKGNDIMLQTFEAEMQPNGMLRFSGFDQPKYDAIQKVLVTIMAEKTDKSLPPTPSVTKNAAALRQAWNDWGAGTLVGSPNLNEDPAAIQKAMRDEQR
jgi:hypothetical protein